MVRRNCCFVNNIFKEVISLTGEEVRELILASGAKLWQVAERFGCTDGNFSRKLRHNFSEADSDRVVAIVKELMSEANNTK